MSDTTTRSTSGLAATRKWAERLERFAARKQTVAAFCTAEGVSTANFYLWRRRLTAPESVRSVAGPSVVPLRVAPVPATSIELALPSGAVLRFPIDAGPELLVAVLRGLEERPC
jgi:transposase